METQLVSVEGMKRELTQTYLRYAKFGVEEAHKMGLLLIKIKDQVGHGNFGKWVEDNLPFSWKTACTYMTVHRMYIRDVGLDPSLGIEGACEQAKKLGRKEPDLIEYQPKPKIQLVEKTEYKRKFNGRREISKPEPNFMRRNNMNAEWKEKVRACHKEYNAALKKGLLVKPKNCEKCGKETLIHGHHKDYDKPLEVEWLCVRCHNKSPRVYPPITPEFLEEEKRMVLEINRLYRGITLEDTKGRFLSLSPEDQQKFLVVLMKIKPEPINFDEDQELNLKIAKDAYSELDREHREEFIDWIPDED